MKREKIHLKFLEKMKFGSQRAGLFTIAGGKLTGYRKMAETIVDT